MAPAEDRRAEILERLADHMLAAGLAGSSLRPLAKAAGTSDRMLLYYFPTKEALVAATLERIAARQAALLEARMDGQLLPVAALRRRLAETLFAPDLWPYMRLWLEVAAAAAGGDEQLRTVSERIARGFLAWGEAQLDLPPGLARTAEAARLLVTLEGMLLLKSFGLADIAAHALD
jgi:AcrR family transcriptional regulator